MELGGDVADRPSPVHFEASAATPFGRERGITVGHEVLLLGRRDSSSIHIPPGGPHPLANDPPTVTNLTRHNS